MQTRPQVSMIENPWLITMSFLVKHLSLGHQRSKNVVSRSNTKLKYRALVDLVVEITWICSLLNKLKFPLPRNQHCGVIT